jgi:precorrin-6Y C5,15-methyltransferase (decarboxylating)
VIAVVGVGCSGGPDRLSEAAVGLIDGADLVVGAPRHLALVNGLVKSPGRAARSLELSGDLEPALAAIGAARGATVVLASGDPGFFGIVRALAGRFGRDCLQVLPAPSSVAAAFARLGMAWDDAQVVSAHGRDPRPAINACRAHPKVAVLTSPEFGPAQLASELAGLGRRLLVAERLGEPDERVVEGSAESVAGQAWRDPNVVVVFDAARAVSPVGRAWPRRAVPTRWGLAEEAFHHPGGMVTKWEVRALALARLGPGMGDLVWDVGAGSGSVGIECAHFGAAVVAVERREAACGDIARNAEAHGVQLSVVRGEAPEALAGLPTPDAVFVGGSGSRLDEILEVVAARVLRVVVVTLVGLDRVVPARARLEAGGLASEVILVQSARLEPLAGHQRLTPTNPVFLISAVRA